MLYSKLKNEDKPKCWVIKQSPKDIDVVGINDSAVDLIEHVHQDIGMEADGVKDKAICRFLCVCRS